MNHVPGLLLLCPALLTSGPTADLPDEPAPGNETIWMRHPGDLKETWESGEWFLSGMVWNLGKGKVFYFRLGHETFPIFKQPEVIKVLGNACLWMGRD